MAKICSWCSNKISLTDMMYIGIDTGSKWHYVCGDCSRKIDSVKKGYTTIEEIATDGTAPELFKYYLEREEKSQKKIQQYRVKEELQKTNPLYDDIHQIARDLRFIKNYLIFTIIVGIILGIIVACSNM